jgi:hypothetical protein
VAFTLSRPPALCYRDFPCPPLAHTSPITRFPAYCVCARRPCRRGRCSHLIPSSAFAIRPANFHWPLSFARIRTEQVRNVPQHPVELRCIKSYDSLANPHSIDTQWCESQGKSYDVIEFFRSLERFSSMLMRNLTSISNRHGPRYYVALLGYRVTFGHPSQSRSKHSRCSACCCFS